MPLIAQQPNLLTTHLHNKHLSSDQVNNQPPNSSLAPDLNELPNPATFRTTPTNSGEPTSED
ncbi:hypothetical protein Csa_016581, partial [Cucumis sativus]